MLTTATLVRHVLVSLTMIGLILVKSGRGGGLSDVFGGGAVSSFSGSTVVERNIDRLTLVIGVLFAVTTVTLSLRLV